jgi:hypothetical protein
MKQKALFGIIILVVLLVVIYAYSPVSLSSSAEIQPVAAPVQVEQQPQDNQTTNAPQALTVPTPIIESSEFSFTEKQLDPKFDWSQVDLANISYG